MSQIIITAEERPEINRLRRKARRFGMRIEKSRKGYSHNHQGGLQLIDDRNTVVAGVDFDMRIEEADYWIDRFGSR